MPSGVFLLLLASPGAHAILGTTADAARSNPVEKVVQMLGDLQQKIIKEGEVEQKEYSEFSEWCEEESKNLQFEIKTAKAEIEELKATIEKADSDIKAFDETIEEQAGSIATDEKDLKDATDIRNKEHADFVAEEAELVDTVDTLERAIGIIEKEMKKTGSAAFLQLNKQYKNAASLAAALKTLLEATSVSTGDSKKITALLQSQQEAKDDEDDEDMGAPAPDAYKSQSGGIVDILEDLLNEAEGELSELRKKETNSLHNYELLKQELTDSIAAATKEKDDAEKGKAAAAGTKALAEGDLTGEQKSLAEDTQLLADAHHDCMEKASDFEISTQSRGEELKALAKAKEIISEMTGGAAAQSYSFFQIAGTSSLKTSADLANYEVVKYVRSLSKKLQSPALAQLANQLQAAARIGAAGGEDPFAKVKTLITDMIAKLIKDAEADAGHKNYCDKEMADTKVKKKELSDEIDKLSTKIDMQNAESATLKEDVATLSKELTDLKESQLAMDTLRKEEKDTYEKNKPEMEQGIEGIKLALKVLKEYYAKGKGAQGAGDGIINMLEVIESDFSKGLAEMISAEESAAAEYEKITKENELTKVSKEQDVKYKTKTHKSLDKSSAELSADKEGLETELDAVLDYWEKIKEQCIAKPEPYEERKKRREAEIAGLKEALSILEGEAFIQQRQHNSFKRHHFLHRA